MPPKTPTRDFNYFQMVPPNTPNVISDDEEVKPAVEPSLILNATEDEEADEGKLVINIESSDPKPFKKRMKSSAQKKKSVKQPRNSIVPDSKPDQTMRNVTSRFGRVISLKVPQF